MQLFVFALIIWFVGIPFDEYEELVGDSILLIDDCVEWGPSSCGPS